MQRTLNLKEEIMPSRTSSSFLKVASLCGAVLASSVAYSQSHPLQGIFSGMEQLTVSRCIEKKSTSPWQATFEVAGNRYTGQGSSTDGGTFTFAGKINGADLIGTVEGRTAEGRLWEGKTRGALTKEGKLVMRIDGTAPMADCDIAVRIKAAKSTIR
jgi:hypothetical protein